jgi:NitT/TauT family transport system substrate-binding protein
MITPKSLQALARVAAPALCMLAALGGASTDVTAQETVSVRLKWLAQAQFAGLYVARAKGYYAAEGLNMTINPGGPNLNAESLVASGADTFALGGGIESSLASRDKKLPVVTLGMLHQRTPVVMVVLEDSPIQKIQDFKGKKITSFFTGLQHTVVAMLAKNGLSPGDYSLSAQAVSMTPFINRETDVAMVTLFNELNVLKARGVKVRTFAPDDYGVSVPRDSLITSEKMIAEKPKAVQGFMNATLRGWKYALQNQAEAVDIVMAAAPGLDRAHQVAMLQEVGKLMLADSGTTEGLGVLNMTRLKAAQDLLVDAKVLSGPVDFNTGFAPQFWNAVPAADKKM